MVRHEYHISYGESVSMEAGGQTHGAGVTWTVSPQTGVSQAKGEGNSTGALTFTAPGTYEVTFTLAAHGNEPAHTDKATVEVRAERMAFVPAEATLSRKLVKGQPMDGITLSIPVNVNTIDNSGLAYGPAALVSTGVLGITATLAETVTLKNGTQVLSFKLSGTPQYSGAAQIGFFNPAGEGFFYNFLIAEQ